jgi:adenylyl-sulfate kinase
MSDAFTFSPAVIWLTGLSGAGKTTIAVALQELLQHQGITPVLLDGDEIRKAIQLTSFDEESRKQHNLKVGEMASALEAENKIVIVALISPYADIRNIIRQQCKRFVEVYVATDINTCIERDPKGLYKKAISGEIKDFTGISAPYFPPEHPELIIDTTQQSPAASAQQILALINSKA